MPCNLKNHVANSVLIFNLISVFRDSFEAALIEFAEGTIACGLIWKFVKAVTNAILHQP